MVNHISGEIAKNTAPSPADITCTALNAGNRDFSIRSISPRIATPHGTYSADANAQMDMPTKIRTVTLGEERRDRLPLKLDADGGIKPATTTIPSRQKMKNAQPLHRPTS
jgi:hypothetical protein